ncbi:uncharacterized protein LOC119412358 [Nematolebias whitei]|uniref:uncharacterized protein LOC119412358 n=1 Tax=Nematolebias whitei TaxID=451745 RepID=UPI001898980E|nr:uncharacterized protein LOC119412358 [Nematolebias whitei]
MAPKRSRGTASPTEPHVKVIKIGGDGDMQDFHSESMEERFRMAEESSPSPPPNNEHEVIDFDEDSFTASGIRTDTISLLMKIDQLQAQLKYERRCRILAERELRELREMNSLMLQMRHTAHELRITLDHVLHGGPATVGSQNPEELVTFLPEPEVQMRTVDNMQEDDPNFLYLSESLRVPKNLYERIAEIADYKKYVSALLMILFDRDTLATHCLQSRKSSLIGEDNHKPALPSEILKGFMDHVAGKFGVDSNLIKTAIRTKLNNEDKLMKKRLGLNRAAADKTISQDASLLPKIEPMTNDSEF